MATSPDPAGPYGSSSTSQLKRLSLVPPPVSSRATGPVPRTPDPGRSGPWSPPGAAVAPAGQYPQPRRGLGDRTPPPAAGPSTPRRSSRAATVRSSIAYASPAVPSRISGLQDQTTPKARGDQQTAPIWEEGAASGHSGRGEAGDGDRDRPKRGETLVELHAELVTLIAQKQRRVNELRQELSAQEASLAQLKDRWTSLVSRHTLASHPQTIHRIRPNASSGPSSSQAHQPVSHDPRRSPNPDSSSASFPSPLLPSLGEPAPPEPAPPDQSFTSLLSSIPGTLPLHTDKILSGQAIEGGRRFWDQLVKTVSAAAAGTVPDGLAPWSTTASETAQGVSSGNASEAGSAKAGRRPAEPANAARLSHSSLSDLEERSGDTTTGEQQPHRTTMAGGVGNLLGDWLTDEAGELGTKTLTPQRSPAESQSARRDHTGGKVDPTPPAGVVGPAPPAGSKGRRDGARPTGRPSGPAEESGSEDEWGW